jgi:hypothetical protein
MRKIFASVLFAASTLVSAHAASIIGLVNTGGTFAGGAQDTNYVLNGTSNGYVTTNGSFPLGPWLANSTTSKWITPTATQGQSFDPSTNGLYSWTLKFNLTGFDASSASFTGKFAADNSAIAKLNGVQIGTSSGFTSFSNFAANSGFNSGLNTLEFLVTNLGQSSGNPTGLRVEFSNSVVTAVPEPETYALMLAGLGLIGAVSRRRNKNKSI